MQKKLRNKILISTLLIIIIISFFAWFFNYEFSAIKDDPFSTSKLNFLITGYDSEIDGATRADTIILASIDLDSSEIGVLFIPRDTRVDIPEYGTHKINSSYAMGGISLVKETVESFLNIPVDYYIDMNFEGFSRFIDLLGGIEVNVEKDMHYVDEAGDLTIDISAGKKVLDGEEALHYVRYREESLGDIGRVKRQQKFLNALLKKIKQPEIIIKLPQIYQQFQKTVKTNIPFQDISPFIGLAKNLNLEYIKTEIVPGTPEYIDDVSYWVPKKEKLNILVNNLIKSKEYINNNKYRVVLLNGNGKSGAAGELGEIMSKYGFRISKIGNAPHFNYEKTEIIYHDTQTKNLAIGIQELIGGKIEYREENEDQDDIIIIIGEDFINS